MLGNPMMAVMLVSGNPGSKWWIFQPRLRPEGRPEAMRYEFVVSWQERPQRGDSLISVVDQTGPHLIRGMLQRDLLDSRLEWFFRLDPLNTLDITTMLQLTSQHPFFFTSVSIYFAKQIDIEDRIHMMSDWVDYTTGRGAVLLACRASLRRGRGDVGQISP